MCLHVHVICMRWATSAYAGDGYLGASTQLAIQNQVLPSCSCWFRVACGKWIEAFVLVFLPALCPIIVHFKFVSLLLIKAIRMPLIASHVTIVMLWTFLSDHCMCGALGLRVAFPSPSIVFSPSRRFELFLPQGRLFCIVAVKRPLAGRAVSEN